MGLMLKLLLAMLKDMDLLSDMRLFARIVSAGSLSAAGRELGLSPGAVSQRLKNLESHYRIALINRSSRTLSLTDEGRFFLNSAERILEEAAGLESTLSLRTTELQGRLRVAAPVDLGKRFVEPLLIKFKVDNPGLCPELHLSDALDDLVGDDFDVIFRYGNLQDSALIARPLAPNRRLVVGSPGYISEHGRPLVPEDLIGHKCLVLTRGLEKLDRWTFGIGGEPITIQVTASLATNDGQVLRNWALGGLGLALKSYLDVCEDILSGHLIEVLNDFSLSPVGAHIVYSKSRRETPRIKAFVEQALTAFEATFKTASSDKTG